jgi:hypothetical protein
MGHIAGVTKAKAGGLACLFCAAILAVTVAPPVLASGDQVIIHRGDPIQVAVVLDHSGSLSGAGNNARNAVQMALAKHSLIRGFGVQLNDFDGPCANPSVAADIAAQVVANPANVAVIGHMCSPDEHAALPIYQQAGVVTMSGTATGPLNPGFGPDVFNSVDVPDDTPGESNAWYARVQQLPRDLAWQADYAARFGSSPGPFADLYFDAASVILSEIASASTLVNGDLVIDRATLESSVRSLSRSTAQGFNGVTCWIKLDSRGYRVNDPASLDSCAKQSGRTVETSAFSVAWNATDPEQIDSLVWRGASMTGTGTVGGLPAGCHFAEYFGNSWAVNHYPFMLVGDSAGTWDRSGAAVRIMSASTGCEGSIGVGVATTYRFFENGPAANSFIVERTFSFGSTPADFDIRPYVPRLFPRDTYNQVLHPDSSGTALVTDSISPCEFGCDVTNWNGTWFAANDPQTGRGVMLIRRSSSPAALWIDMDGASNTAASSAVLIRPSGGFTGIVVETEVLCFYDSATWPDASRAALFPPAGCRQT